MTSFNEKYLGHASFAPVYAELNRRKAIVYVHPRTPDCCRNMVSEMPASGVEYTTDTTRTIGSLVFSGTAARYPDVRWIFSHSGGKGALDALRALAPPSQILFGTDYPMRPAQEEVDALAAYGFASADLQAFDRENVLRLIPRLKA